MQREFTKMNGAGNDFVVIDNRLSDVSCQLSAEQVKMLSSRANPITKGCDQLLILEKSDKADVFMRIYNADGGEVDACGNATRCIGWLIIKEQNISPDITNTDTAITKIHHKTATIQTKAGILSCKQVIRSDIPPNYKNSDALIEADMGTPTFEWQQIPLDYGYNDKILFEIGKQLGIEGIEKAICVGMGNPHVVFFVKNLPIGNALNLDIKDVLRTAGEKIRDGEIDLFRSNGINLTIAEIPSNPETIFSKVYERGAGITKSCGTGACATAVAAIKLGYREKDFDIDIQQMQCGVASLIVRWASKEDHVKLIGIVETENDWTPIDV